MLSDQNEYFSQPYNSRGGKKGIDPNEDVSKLDHVIITKKFS